MIHEYYYLFNALFVFQMNKYFNDIAVFLIIIYAFQTLMNVPNNQESVTTTATTLGGHFAAAADQATLSTKTTGERISSKAAFTRCQLEGR